MKKNLFIFLGSAVAAVLGFAAIMKFGPHSTGTTASTDPRERPPVVRLVAATPISSLERSFTGVIAARVQSNLGFRITGKIAERLVNIGQQVKAGQPLMRIDDNDYLLALAAKRNTVSVIRASVIQFRADEARYAKLIKSGWSTRQRYDQAKAALDAAEAQLSAAEAEAQVAGNEAAYAILRADADGTVVETLGEPGQVVIAGQPVIRLAQAGPREAVISLPETIRPAIGSKAEASIYGRDEHYTSSLRQLSDAADSQTRTYEARFVLDGEAALAPIGATVTVRFASQTADQELEVPLGAVLDDGKRTGVWVVDPVHSTVSFRPVKLVRITDESAVISGLDTGSSVVSPGAHLLQEGERVRTNPESSGT